MENYYVSHLSMVSPNLIANTQHQTSGAMCVISHNPIMPALINHLFGGDLEGLFGATPFEVLHQLLLGIFKNILELLYNYRTIPEEWTCFFKEIKSPDIPENISDQKRITETTDTAFLDQEQPMDTRTSYQKYLHWQKS